MALQVLQLYMLGQVTAWQCLPASVTGLLEIDKRQVQESKRLQENEYKLAVYEGGISAQRPSAI
jgi:hypothetical protein